MLVLLACTPAWLYSLPDTLFFKDLGSRFCQLHPYPESRVVNTFAFHLPDNISVPSSWSSTYVLGLGLSLMLLCFLKSLWSIKLRKKTNRLLQDKNELILKQKQELEQKATLLEETNCKLVELDHFKQGFTHMIVHDMKNSLNAIIGLSQGHPNQQKMDTIYQSGQYILNMAMNMLDAQRLQDPGLILVKQPHFVEDLVKEALSSLEFQLNAKTISVNNELPENLLVYADRNLLVRVIGNLLSNAIRFSGTDAMIDIMAIKNTSDRQIEISITDYGEGILPENINHIFDQYWQTSGANSMGFASTGLGLAFCKLAVESHGGKIKVESEYNEFSCFSFSIPFPTLNEAEGDYYSSQHNPVPHIILDQDLPLLQKYGEKLAVLKVHEFSKINRIVKEMEKSGVESAWTEQLITAVHRGDQLLFNKLLSMLQ